MTAPIISMTSLRDQTAPPVDKVPSPTSQFDIYVGCLMTTGYTLSESLLGPTSNSSLKVLGRFVDDPALLAKIAAHRERHKLCRLLLGLVMAESARSSLWSELESTLLVG